MKTHSRPQSASADIGWRSPLDASAYDRAADLSAAECTAIEYMVGHLGQQGHCSTSAVENLKRLSRPLWDTLTWLGRGTFGRYSMLGVLCWGMRRYGRSYWSWTEAEWAEVFCPSGRAFFARYLTTPVARPRLMVMAYLLGLCTSLRTFGSLERLGLARKVFGRAAVDAAAQDVNTVAQRIGFAGSRLQNLDTVMAAALLSNRSPDLRDLTLSALDHLRRDGLPRTHEPDVVVLSRVLHALGIVERPLGRVIRRRTPDPTEGIDPRWLHSCQRWLETSTLGFRTRLGFYNLLLKAGRWVTATHPQCADPDQWTREVAAEYVAAVDRMRVGEWVRVDRLGFKRRGEPMSAKSKTHHLAAMRAFFRDCQEWGWMAHRLDPRRCFAAPQAILRQIGPNPRVIADDVWAKLLWAGVNLQESDLPKRKGPWGDQGYLYYPVSMVRAMAILWLFAGLRVDEMVRLRVGCVRWKPLTQHAGAGSPSHPPTCFLDIPVNKTSAAFTKPVDGLVGQAIEAWERERLKQPLLLDRKTGERVAFVFCHRGVRVRKGYFNDSLIPTLCRKAGVPEDDARGRITSHRGRSTIATQLFNAKEPMSLFELQEWLGHKSPESTRHYARITPTKLLKAYVDAGYFTRNVRAVEVLVDQDAIRSGAAADGQPWKFYDLGHGYCTYDFFDQCPHRMACAKCAFYRPKPATSVQLSESRSNLVRMRQEIPLNEDELAAVEDGIGAVERLLAKLKDVPTPGDRTS